MRDAEHKYSEGIFVWETIRKDCIQWLSEEEHRADALALRADERRDKLRKAAGSGKYTVIRRYLNGETHVREPYVSMPEPNRVWRGTR